MPVKGSGGLDGGDAVLSAGSRARREDDDVDIAFERGQQTEQTLERVLAEVAAPQPRHVGLGEPEQARGLGPGDAALADDGVDAADELGLQQVRIGVGQVEIGKYVAAAAFDGGSG